MPKEDFHFNSQIKDISLKVSAIYDYLASINSKSFFTEQKKYNIRDSFEKDLLNYCIYIASVDYKLYKKETEIIEHISSYRDSLEGYYHISQNLDFNSNEAPKSFRLLLEYEQMEYGVQRAKTVGSIIIGLYKILGDLIANADDVLSGSEWDTIFEYTKLMQKYLDKL